MFRTAFSNLLRSAVEVDRTIVVYLEVVVTVLKCSLQTDALCSTSINVEVIAWATTVRFRVKANVNSMFPHSIGFSYAELVGFVIVANHCSPASAIVCRSE